MGGYYQKYQHIMDMKTYNAGTRFSFGKVLQSSNCIGSLHFILMSCFGCA